MTARDAVRNVLGAIETDQDCDIVMEAARRVVTRNRSRVALYQWAHAAHLHGMADPAEMEAAGWTAAGRDERYGAVLMRREAGE